MNLCLVMMGRFERANGVIYADKKNINAIKRYLKYFEHINVVAREIPYMTESLYPKEKIRFSSNEVTFYLYEENGKKLIPSKEFFTVYKDALQKSDIMLGWAETKSIINLKLAKKNKVPSIIYVGGCNRDIIRSRRSIIRYLTSFLIYYDNKFAVKNSDYVHYVTSNSLQKRYPTRAPSIGASFVQIDVNMPKEKLIKRIKKYNTSPIKKIGLIGYLNEVKGVDLAIKSLSMINENIELHILGGGNKNKYKKIAEKWGVENRVYFDGTLPPGDAVLEWLDDIDIYIQPSRSEGLPRATIEAMSRGCPVISSSALGLSELIDKRWRYQKNDYKMLATLLNKLSNNIIYLKEQAYKNYYNSKNYDSERQMEIIDDFFYKIKTRTIEKSIGE